MAFVDLSDNLKSVFTGVFRCGKRESARFVSSKDVEAKLRACAKKHANDLGENERKEIPNRYEVLFSRDDWDNYFGVRIEESQRKFASFVYRFGRKSPYYLVGSPIVELACDGSLGRGEVRIEPSFVEPIPLEFEQDSDPSQLEANDSADEVETEPIKEDISELKTEKVRYGDNVVGDQFAPGDTPPMPRDDERSYLVDLDNGQRSVVRPGYTVGLSIGGGNPEISLDPERFKYVSRKHGQFSSNGVSWSFHDYGENGTEIRFKEDDRTVMLREGEKAVLENGCLISFAGGSEYEWVSGV